MAEIIEKFTFDDSEVVRSLERIENALQAVESDAKAIGDAMDASMKEAKAAIDETSGAIESNADAVHKQKAALDAANKNLTTWRSLLKQGTDSLTLGGKTIGEWREQLAQGHNALKQVTTGTQNMGVAQKALNLILKASPIFIIVAVLTAVVAWFGKFQKVTEAVRGTMAAMSAVVEVVVKRLMMLGDAMLAVFRGDFQGAAKSASAAFDGLGNAIANAADRALMLERRTYALQKAMIESSMTTARQAAAIEQLQRTAEDETLSAIERETARRQAMQLSNDMATRREKLAREGLSITQEELLVEKQRLEELIRSGATESEIIAQRAKAKAEADSLSLDGRERLRDAEIELFDVQRENEAALQELNKIGREIEQKRREEAQKAAEQMKKDLAEIGKLLAENTRLIETDAEARALSDVNRKFDEQIKKTKEAAETLAAIERRRGLTPEQLAQKKTLAEQEVALEDARMSAILDVLTDYAEKQAEIENGLRRKQQKEARDAAVKAIADQRTLSDLQIDELEIFKEQTLKVLKSKGASEKELQEEQAAFDREIQRARLQTQLTYLEKSLALTGETDAAAIEQLKQQIANVKRELSGLDTADGEDKPKSVWDMLGITDEEQQEGMKMAVAQIQESLKSLAQTRIEAAERTVSARQKEVDALESALGKEKELQEKGLANNVALREKELATAKAQRDKALKEEAKARRAAILLDSVQQVSGLVTSSVNIFKALSGIPFVGIPLAIATIGLMFGAFAKAKSQALKAAEAPKLRKGAKIKGKTHEQGGEWMIDPTGSVYEVEDGEWLIGTAHSREHDEFLGNLNKGEYKGLDLAKMAKEHRARQNPISSMMPGVDFVQAQRREVEHALQYNIMREAYTAGAERIVRAIEAKEVVFPFKNGYRVQRKQGNTKIVETILPD